MNEAETRAELIDPALKAVGWGVADASRIGREVIAPGRIVGGGRRTKADIADSVLIYKGQKLAVIEAKRRDWPDTEGLAQAKRYAQRLQTRFAYSTNGAGIYRADMQTGAEGYAARYPSPQELWDETFAEKNIWRERFGKVPFEDRGGFWQTRYYQHNAINLVLEAISEGKNRILLTLATGTGKTAIAFQIAWKLFYARWSLAARKIGEPGPRPRILFLADRNILANQAFNDFSAFPKDALVRIDPKIIRKKGRVPKNRSIFFTIFQTFMTGRDESDHPAPRFGDYPSDFFDFIIKVRQIVTTLDDYVYTADDEILDGEIEQGRRYTEEEFNRVIEIKEREQYRVRLFMEQINPREKTLVFCATQLHALAVRDLVSQSQFKASTDPHYCVRVTADDGKEGDRLLALFRDNEKSIPTILTTSQKLSTGVDARNVRNIVLMRPVNTISENYGHLFLEPGRDTHVRGPVCGAVIR